ncbi:MAG: hypothetical protein ACRDQ9_07660, partial [Pseudonocardiaceae bacterium]
WKRSRSRSQSRIRPMCTTIFFRMLFHGEALVQKGEIAEACLVMGKVVTRTATYTSLRLNQRITELLGTLAPWQRSKPVRELTELMKASSRSPRGSIRT